jgi:5'-methylthioadenosine/S-adenosylhomocysteine nucleosidase
MEQEVSALLRVVQVEKQESWCGFSWAQGHIDGKAVVISRCGIGKAFAAMLTQRLIDRFNPSALLFTGVAGAVDPELEPGDIILGQRLIHHDLDVCALGFERGQIPFTDLRYFHSDPELLESALRHQDVRFKTLAGCIGTGDQFVTNPAPLRSMGITCVDMEGAAVAQVCTLQQIPFLILRIVSDRADGSAKNDFETNLPLFADRSLQLIRQLLSAPGRTALNAPQNGSGLPIPSGDGTATPGSETLARLQSRIRELEARIEENDAFMSILAHDLKNPIGSVYSASGMLDLSAYPESDREVLQWITAESRRLYRFVEDLLRISRFFNRWQASPTKASVIECLLRSSGRAFEEAALRQVRLQHPTDFDSARCPIDPNALEELLRNLQLFAAMQAPPESTVQIRIPQAGPDLELEIVIEGLILDDPCLQRLFEPYQRNLEPDLRPEQIALRMGMHLSKRIAGQLSLDLSCTRSADRTILRLKS